MSVPSLSVDGAQAVENGGFLSSNCSSTSSKLLGIQNDDLTNLADYVEAVSKATGVPVPVHAPVVGRDAFRTATGVHAAAIIKAQNAG